MLQSDTLNDNAEQTASATAPELFIRTDGLCDGIGGFVVHEIAFSDGGITIDQLAIDFQKQCVPCCTVGFASTQTLVFQDGIPNWRDNSPSTANPDQTDRDGDGFGDTCDPVVGETYIHINRDWNEWEEYSSLEATGEHISAFGNIGSMVTFRTRYNGFRFDFQSSFCRPMLVGSYTQVKRLESNDLNETGMALYGFCGDELEGEFYILEGGYDNLSGKPSL